jgi:hypothetical protein
MVLGRARLGVGHWNGSRGVTRVIAWPHARVGRGSVRVGVGGWPVGSVGAHLRPGFPLLGFSPPPAPPTHSSLPLAPSSALRVGPWTGGGVVTWRLVVEWCESGGGASLRFSTWPDYLSIEVSSSCLDVQPCVEWVGHAVVERG